MQTDRRGFLRWATGAVAALLARPAAAAAPAPETARGIHRATRNTRTGALRDSLRAYRAARRPWKPYPGRARLPLPPPAWEDGRPLLALASRPPPPPVAFTGEPCTLTELSRALLLTNGITRPDARRPLRAAPSAGALYAGEVYAVVDRVKGIAPGVYAYAVRRHALVALREGAALDEVARALERPELARGAAFALLLCNVFGRYAVRYGHRGYRYALIDSGHIGENLRLAAEELGLRARAAPRFEDDRLNALLGIDGREEAVCALHLVGRPGGAPLSAPATRRLVERGVRDPGALSGDLPAPVRYHASTKLAAEGAGVAASDGGAPDPTPRRADAAAAPPAPASSMAVHAAIRVRRSTRHFAPAPLPRPDLLRLLGAAQGPREPSARGIALYVVAHRVSDLRPGLYRWVPDAGVLALRRHAELADPLVQACLGQRKTGEAAAALIAVARLAGAGAPEGARGYRDLLLAAGATAQRTYLAAEALGHSARNLAAYYDDELDALLGLDGVERVAVHLTAVGPGD